METEHTVTQEKISLLTEATFAITNMLAGVQGIDTMKLLEATDGTVGSGGDARRMPGSYMGKMQGVADNVQGAVANVQEQQGKAKRSVMIAGANAGRDTPAR